jgi:MOSC domain-containing protein YiiM
MISIEAAPEGKVVAVCADPKHRFSKTPRPSITLIAGHGIEGDAHFGSFVKHRYLARRKPRSPNMRQVHLIPTELLYGLRKAGYDVEPGDLRENITTAGLDVEELPLDTELRIGSATIRLTGLRTPCVLIDRFGAGLKAHLVAEKPGPPFRAGVMAIVTGGGLVVPGDDIRATLPATPRRALPAI